MHLEVRHLRLIHSIAEAGSVTRAADRLYLTQSALSHQLRDIEEKLGVALFKRMNKKMILTPAGGRVLSAANRILEELTRAEEDIRHIALNREALLRISTECHTCYHWLPSLLKTFSLQHPRIEVQIVVEATRDPHSALLDGKIDLALVSAPVRNSKLRYEPLFRDELVVIVGKDHSLRSRSFVRAVDFVDEHLIIYSEPAENRAVQQVLVPAGVSPKRISSVQLTEAIVEMVTAGVGIGILSRWSVAQHIEAGRVFALPITKPGLFRRWSAATLKNKARPEYLDAFVKLLADNPVLIMNRNPKAKRRPGLRLLKAVDCSRPANTA